MGNGPPTNIRHANENFKNVLPRLWEGQTPPNTHVPPQRCLRPWQRQSSTNVHARRALSIIEQSSTAARDRPRSQFPPTLYPPPFLLPPAGGWRANWSVTLNEITLIMKRLLSTTSIFNYARGGGARRARPTARNGRRRRRRRPWRPTPPYRDAAHTAVCHGQPRRSPATAPVEIYSRLKMLSWLVSVRDTTTICPHSFSTRHCILRFLNLSVLRPSRLYGIIGTNDSNVCVVGKL